VELPELLSGLDGLVTPTWISLAVSCCSQQTLKKVQLLLTADNKTSSAKTLKQFQLLFTADNKTSSAKTLKQVQLLFTADIKTNSATVHSRQ